MIIGFLPTRFRVECLQIKATLEVIRGFEAIPFFLELLRMGVIHSWLEHGTRELFQVPIGKGKRARADVEAQTTPV